MSVPSEPHTEPRLRPTKRHSRGTKEGTPIGVPPLKSVSDGRGISVRDGRKPGVQGDLEGYPPVVSICRTTRLSFTCVGLKPSSRTGGTEDGGYLFTHPQRTSFGDGYRPNPGHEDRGHIHVGRVRVYGYPVPGIHWRQFVSRGSPRTDRSRGKVTLCLGQDRPDLREP